MANEMLARPAGRDNASFRPVPGYDGHYEISSAGVVRSVARMIERRGSTPMFIRAKELKWFNGDGYYFVKLCRPGRTAKTIAVHRLVALAFIERPEGMNCVNHLDGDKKNNDPSNLEWTTQSQNMKHAWANKLCRGVKKELGEMHHQAKLTNDQVIEARKRYAAGERAKLLAEEYGLTRTAFHSMLTGKTWGYLPGAVDPHSRQVACAK